MLRTLVVPLDGSPLAERAIPYAIGLAQASHAWLVLMQAMMPPPLVSLEGVDWERQQREAIGEGRQYLASMAESLAGQVSGVAIATPYGRAVDKIVETIAAFDADGVVMATHGRTGFAHLLYGSVTEGLLARSSVPVFVVYARPGEPPAPPFSAVRARVLVPMDGSAYDDAALRTAFNMVGPGGELVLVTVATPPEHVERDTNGRVLAYLDQQEEARTREAREYLSEMAQHAQSSTLARPVKVDVRIGDPASGIAMAAIDNQTQLIVMATHGRTGLRRAVFGSVAGSVLRTGTTPVVLVHPAPPQPPTAGVEQPIGVEVGPVPTF